MSRQQQPQMPLEPRLAETSPCLSHAHCHSEPATARRTLGNGPNDLILPIEEMGLNLLEGIADSGYDRSEHRWAVHPTINFSQV
jgi:hypothetical protein